MNEDTIKAMRRISQYAGDAEAMEAEARAKGDVVGAARYFGVYNGLVTALGVLVTTFPAEAVAIRDGRQIP
jgi:hypothetical protein